MDKKTLRKLSAIMFTDIVSYSKMMGADEKGALEFLQTHSQIVKEEVEASDGKIIKTIGDAFLVDFDSAVNAVRAAVAIQKRMSEYNQNKADEDKKYIRIGIHLGDVVVSENDILGDGVNIAARIQPIAEPGGICISHDVLSQVKNKIDIRTISLGPQELKNIEEKMEIYSIILHELGDQPKITTHDTITKANKKLDFFGTGFTWGLWNLIPIIGNIVSVIKVSKQVFIKREIIYGTLFLVSFLIPFLNFITPFIFLYYMFNRIGGKFTLGYIFGTLLMILALILVISVGISTVAVFFGDDIAKQIKIVSNDEHSENPKIDTVKPQSTPSPDATTEIRNILPAPHDLTAYTSAAPGDVMYFEVVGNSQGGTIWGSDFYTTDSVLRIAAVHAGILQDGEKGVVKVTFAPGQKNYKGSIRNGVASSDWGQYHLSYKIELDRKPNVKEQKPNRNSVRVKSQISEQKPKHEAQIIRMEPDRGPRGTEILIIGTGFGDRQKGKTLRFGGNGRGGPVQILNWSDTKIRCKFPEDPNIPANWYYIGLTTPKGHWGSNINVNFTVTE